VLVHAVPLHVPTSTTPKYRIAEPRRRRLNSTIPIPIEWDGTVRRLPIGHITQLAVVDNMVIGHGSIEPGSWSVTTVQGIRDRTVNIKPELSHGKPRERRHLGLYIEDWTLDAIVLSGKEQPSLWPEGLVGIMLGT